MAKALVLKSFSLGEVHLQELRDAFPKLEDADILKLLEYNSAEKSFTGTIINETDPAKCIPTMDTEEEFLNENKDEKDIKVFK